MKKASGNLHLHALERIYVYNLFCGDYTDDIELVRGKAESPGTPNLKKSRSLGGSLKKLFRRGRKQDRSIKTTVIETAQDRILIISLTNTNQSQDVKNPPNIQGSPSLWNIDMIFYAIELDEYDWISKKIYTCIYILSSSSIFRY